jgi:hypothetical protein
MLLASNFERISLKGVPYWWVGGVKISQRRVASNENINIVGRRRQSEITQRYFFKTKQRSQPNGSLPVTT